MKKLYVAKLTQEQIYFLKQYILALCISEVLYS